MLAHELAHWASRVVYCDRNGRAKTCQYKGQHNAPFYRVLNEIHKTLGTPNHKAMRLEARAGYHPPDGWLNNGARYSPDRASDVRTKISEGIASAIDLHGSGVNISDADVDRLATISIRTLPPTAKNPNAWAFTITKNWILDQRRKMVRGPIIEAKRREREAKKETFETVVSIHQAELRSIINRLLMEPPPPSIEKALQYVWYAYGQGMNDETIARRMPGTTRNQRYQWKRRALKRILPKASTALQRFLVTPLQERKGLKTSAKRKKGLLKRTSSQRISGFFTG